MNARPETFLRRLNERLQTFGKSAARQESQIRRQAMAARWMVKHTGVKNAAE